MPVSFRLFDKTVLTKNGIGQVMDSFSLCSLNQKKLLQNVFYNWGMYVLLLESCIHEPGTRVDKEQEVDSNLLQMPSATEKGWLPALQPLIKPDIRTNIGINWQQFKSIEALHKCSIPQSEIPLIIHIPERRANLIGSFLQKLGIVQHPKNKKRKPLQITHDCRWYFMRFPKETMLQAWYFMRFSKETVLQGHYITSILMQRNKTNPTSLRWTLQDCWKTGDYDYISVELRNGFHTYSDTEIDVEKVEPTWILSNLLEGQSANNYNLEIIKDRIESFLKYAELDFCMEIQSKQYKEQYRKKKQTR